MKPRPTPARAAPRQAAATATPLYAAPATHRLPAWLTTGHVVRALLLAFAALLPVLYDSTVPEVSGDIRWTATELLAGLCGLLLLGGKIARGETLWQGRMGGLGAVALAYIFWNLLSMVDALNVLRALPLIKGLTAQVLLGFCAAAVWTPRFGRQLIWALVLPLGFVAFLGTAQFFDWTDNSFKYTVLPEFLRWVWPDSGIIDPLIGFYLQSAVPGASFANKNLAGSWTAMMLPLALYLMLTTPKLSLRMLASGLLAAGSLFLLYSRARASWISLVFGLCVLAGVLVINPVWRRALLDGMRLHAKGPFERPAWRRLVWLLPTVMLLAWQFNVTSPNSTTYAINITPGKQMSNLAEANWDDVGGRLAYNLNSLAITRDHWFNGVGLGSFYVIYPPYNDAIVPTPLNSYSVMARPQRTHSDMMQAFDESGIPGGLLFLSIFGIAAFIAFGRVSRRAGWSALALVFTGYSLMVMMVAMLLSGSSVVPQTPWAVIMSAALLGFGGTMALAYLWARQRMESHTDRLDALPLEDRKHLLAALFIGVALVTIFTNCLLDFPFQLPTAPAVVALLMGSLARSWQLRNGDQPAGRLRLDGGRPLLVFFWLLLAVTTAVYAYDNYRFREANQVLKQAMIRIMSGVVDDTTLRLIMQANSIYALDPRIHEHIGVTMANYHGSYPISTAERIAQMKIVLDGDPWGANHLINLIGQYLVLAENAQQQRNLVGANEAIQQAKVLHARLEQSAGNSHYTYGIGGMLALYEGRLGDAYRDFERALQIDPNYAPAKAGLERVKEIMQAKAPADATARL